MLSTKVLVFLWIKNVLQTYFILSLHPFFPFQQPVQTCSRFLLCSFVTFAPFASHAVQSAEEPRLSAQFVPSLRYQSAASAEDT